MNNFSKIIIIGLALFFCLNHRVRAEEEVKIIKAPPFTLPTLDNVSITLEDYRGKFILLNFWATWCGPCRVEMPSLEKLHNTFGKDNFIVVGISIDHEKETVRKFIKEYNLHFTVLYDSAQEASLEYNVTGIPTTFLIDPEGMIIGGSPGARDWATPEYIQFFREKLQSFSPKQVIKEEKPKEIKSGEITPEELRKKIKAKEKFILLDVRNEDEFKAGHIEGAINIPVREIESRRRELDSSMEIVIYCARGMRSSKAVEILLRREFKKLINMKAGYEGWIKLKPLGP